MSCQRVVQSYQTKIQIQDQSEELLRQILFNGMEGREEWMEEWVGILEEVGLNWSGQPEG